MLLYSSIQNMIDEINETKMNNKILFNYLRNDEKKATTTERCWMNGLQNEGSLSPNLSVCSFFINKQLFALKCPQNDKNHV